MKRPPDIHTNGSCSGSSTPSTISPGENTSLEDELSKVSFCIVCFGVVNSVQCVRCVVHAVLEIRSVLAFRWLDALLTVHLFLLFAHSAQYKCLIGWQCDSSQKPCNGFCWNLVLGGTYNIVHISQIQTLFYMRLKSFISFLRNVSYEKFVHMIHIELLNVYNFNLKHFLVWWIFNEVQGKSSL